MFMEMNKLLNDNLKQNTSLEKFIELETAVECLAQSSISADVLIEIQTLIKHLSASSVSIQNFPLSNMEMKLINTLHKKLANIYRKLQFTDELCVDINNCVKSTLDGSEVKMAGHMKQLNIVQKLQDENEIVLKEISNQLDCVKQLEKDTNMLDN